MLGYHNFYADNASIGDQYWWNISLNAKYELTQQRLRPYINDGAGLYFPKQGSNEPGVNLGLGIDYLIVPQWIIEIGVDYHHIFASESDINFNVPKLRLVHYL